MTPKIHPQNLHTKKYIHFSENQQKIEIQDFEQKKWLEPTYIWKYSTYKWKYQSTPPPPPPG